MAFEKAQPRPARPPTRLDGRAGVNQLYAVLEREGATLKHFNGSRFLRARRIEELLVQGRIDDLRWR